MRWTLTIAGMHAVHAKHAVFTALAGVAGVQRAEVELGMVTVEGAGVAIHELTGAIEALGFTVTGVREDRRTLPAL